MLGAPRKCSKTGIPEMLTLVRDRTRSLSQWVQSLHNRNKGHERLQGLPLTRVDVTFPKNRGLRRPAGSHPPSWLPAPAWPRPVPRRAPSQWPAAAVPSVGRCCLRTRQSGVRTRALGCPEPTFSEPSLNPPLSPPLSPPLKPALKPPLKPPFVPRP